MLLLGIDLGTSSIKVSVVDGLTRRSIASAQYHPEIEAEILTLHPGWAEQSPKVWWENTKQAILRANASGVYDPKDIGAIGISYQMHGLVLVDKEQKVLRDAIIWCDSRAVEIGEKAFHELEKGFCLSHLLNSPSNFTASKLAWVKANEPEIYQRIGQALLPGDFLSMKFTGETTTTPSALSEGILWDFREHSVSKEVTDYFGFDDGFFPKVNPVFSAHGELQPSVAAELSLRPGIPVTYKGGDQPNNAFSLNVLNPGEVAATAGTSGVIYGVTDQLSCDAQSRINSFAHINHEQNKPRIGVLLCINGCGIFNRLIRNLVGIERSYDSLNREAAEVAAGSDGLTMLPFCNGAERMLNNQMTGAYFENFDFDIHRPGHMVRAAQEAIAFSFRYGLDLMRENGMNPKIIRAGKANMFLSDVFAESVVNATGVSVELYNTDGSVGAALGAGVGIGYYSAPSVAFADHRPLKLIEPRNQDMYEGLYASWKSVLRKVLHATNEN